MMTDMVVRGGDDNSGGLHLWLSSMMRFKTNMLVIMKEVITTVVMVMIVMTAMLMIR